MKTVPETVGREHFRALRLRRPLLPIEQYAAREGTTVDEIEKCSGIGIVQLRKHHGKTYVVDMPYCCYEANAAADAEVAELIGNAEQNRPEQADPQKQPLSLEENQEPVRNKTSISNGQNTQTVKPGSITELVNKMALNSGKLNIETTADADAPLPQATKQLIDSINTQLDQIESRIKDPAGPSR